MVINNCSILCMVEKIVQLERVKKLSKLLKAHCPAHILEMADLLLTDHHHWA